MVDKAKEQLTEVVFWNGKFTPEQLLKFNETVSRGFYPTLHWFEIPEEARPTQHRHFILFVKTPQ